MEDKPTLIPERALWLPLAPKAGKDGKTETTINYEAFLLYYQMPPSRRSLASVAQQLGNNVRLLERWSATFFWQKRTLAWDRSREEAAAEARTNAFDQEEAARMEGIRWHREKKLSVGKQIYEKTSAMLSMPLTERTTVDGKTTIKPMKWTASDVATWAKTANELCSSALSDIEKETDGLRPEEWIDEPYDPSQEE